MVWTHANELKCVRELFMVWTYAHIGANNTGVHRVWSTDIPR